MPAKTLQEVLETLSGPEKALFENTLKANPELKDGWLRQDDYSRKQTELAADRQKIVDDMAYADRMKAWGDDNWPKLEALQEKGIIDLETGEETWTAKQAEYERQLQEARAAAVGGEDMDPEVLKKNVQAIVKDAGVLSKEELNALIQSEARKLAAETFTTQYQEKEKTFNEKTIPFVTGFSTSMALAAQRYERETGKEFTDDDQRAVFAMMERDKVYDPRKVVASYMEPALQEKKTAAEIERRVQEEVRKRTGGSGMPGGGDEPFIPQTQKGNLKLLMERQDDGSKPVDIESVIAMGARKAAEELRAEGKS